MRGLRRQRGGRKNVRRAGRRVAVSATLRGPTFHRGENSFCYYICYSYVSLIFESANSTKSVCVFKHLTISYVYYRCRLKTSRLVRVRSTLTIRGIVPEIDSYLRRGFVSFVFVVGKVTGKGGGGETSLPCLDRSARSDRFKRAGDAGWYRPFGFAAGQLREALVASILTINMGGFAWQRQV